MTKITQLSIAIILIFNTYCFASNNTIEDNGQSTQSNTIQRVRLDFSTPDGFTRPLLLAFTSNNEATDGIDYGYDALNWDFIPDDLNWIIDGRRFVIQGVGAFDQTKKYPLGLFMSNSATVDISLNTLENFGSPIDVYIHDALLNTYTRINEASFTTDMTSGEYLDRFYIAFQDDSAIEASALSISDNDIQQTSVKYLSNTKELYVKTNNTSSIKQIQVYNILGKELFSINNLNKSIVRIPIENIGTNYGIISVTTEHGIISKKVVLK